MLKRLSLLLLLWLAGSFAWGAAPTITTIAPPSAVVDTVVTITGTDLDKVISVTFNGIAAKTITDNTTTSLKAIVPEGARSGKITVTAADGTTTSVYDFIVLQGIKNNAKDNAEMVWVPGGTFTMGSPDGVGYSFDHPAHQVTLSGYWIYQYDVTVVQYRAFSTATKRELPPFPQPKEDDTEYVSNYSWEGKIGWDDPELQQHPIVNVTWHDAKAYADWAGVQLPTEAQWEYAARGPKGNIYPWGGTVTPPDGYRGIDITKCAYRDNSFNIGKSTWPVGSFPAGTSWCGALDMAGNVAQWCGDWLRDYTAITVTDPIGPATGFSRVVRGGSWHGNSIDYRGMNRSGGNPDDYSHGIGFRCAIIAPRP